MSNNNKPDAESYKAPPTKSGKEDFWFPVLVKDMDRIRKCFPDTASTRFMAWCVLLRDAHFRKTRKIVMADFILADRCGLHVRSIDAIKNDLAEVGLLKFQTKRVKGRHTPTEYTIKKTLPSATIADGSPSVVQGGDSTTDTLISTFSGPPQPPKKIENKTREKKTFSRANSVGAGMPHGSAKVFSPGEKGKARPWRETADRLRAGGLK